MSIDPGIVISTIGIIVAAVITGFFGFWIARLNTKVTEHQSQIAERQGLTDESKNIIQGYKDQLQSINNLLNEQRVANAEQDAEHRKSTADCNKRLERNSRQIRFLEYKTDSFETVMRAAGLAVPHLEPPHFDDLGVDLDRRER